MTKEAKKFLVQILVGGAIYAGAIYLTQTYRLKVEAELALFFTAYIVIGFSAIEKLGDNLFVKYFLDENFLILSATIGAFTIGRYVEGVAVLLFFQVGMAFEEIAISKSKKSIAELIDIRSSIATRKVNGVGVKVDPSELKLRHIIIIRPGEKVPVDAIITAGSSNVDMKALTGEAIPRMVGSGDKLYSGSINLTGVLEARVARIYKDSTASKIFVLVDNAINKKAESEKFITKFARIYTPIVVLLAMLLVIVPFYILGKGELTMWVYRGLTFLIVACPSAMIISVPIAFYGGICAASKRGVLIKGSSYLEWLAKTDTFIFDKTGTLTKGVFEVKEIHPIGMPKEKLLQLAVLAEEHSNHPIAQSLKAAYDYPIERWRVEKTKELLGFGVKAKIDGKYIFIGNRNLMEKEGFTCPKVQQKGTYVHVAFDNNYVGYIIITDSIREDVKATMKILKNHYQAVLVMLTGDNDVEATTIGKELGMDYIYSNLLPTNKVEILEEFLESQHEDEKVAFVGDGINDAPVLARADIGIAMGGLGSDAAIEAADIVLLKDEPAMIISTIKIAKETLRVVKFNVRFSMVIKIVVLVFAAFGYVTMWEAVFADVGVMIIAIINSMWVAKYPD